MVKNQIIFQFDCLRRLKIREMVIHLEQLDLIFKNILKFSI